MKKNILLTFLLFFTNAMMSPRLYAQSTVNFDMSYIVDTNSSFTFNSVKTEKFQPKKKHFVNLGITENPLWIKIKLQAKKSQAKAVLIVNAPFKDRIILSYKLKDGTQIKDSLGIMYAQSKNKFNHYVPAFDLPIHNISNSEIYIKVTSRWSMFVPISIKTKEAFYKERVTSYFIAGLLIGGLLLMAIYNLFLFFSTRDYGYLLYVLALLCSLLSQGYISGILIPYLSPDSPEFSFRFPLITMAFTGIFSSWFTIHFLNIKQTSKLLFYLLLFAISFSVFDIILELLHYDFASRRVNIVLIIGTSLIIFSCGLYSLLKGNKIAIYFTIAWTVYLFGMITFALKTTGIIPHNNFTAHFMNFGICLEVVLLSFALGHKYLLIKIEKEKLEQQTKKELEKLVKIQTNKLETTLEEKEVLLKEIHHRVKNNLQIVMSILDLQVASIKDDKNKAILNQSKSRVYSMSLIHQKLYQSNNLAQININNYLTELFSHIHDSYFIPQQKTTTILVIEEINVSITIAIPLGLIVNELLTNSFKYGLSEAKSGKIKMSLELKNKELILCISDTGPGFDIKKPKFELKESLGLFLVQSLTKQLKGNIQRYFDQDFFTTELTFPFKKNTYEK